MLVKNSIYFGQKQISQKYSKGVTTYIYYKTLAFIVSKSAP